ncbi:MAG TPA: hypothetical protein VFF29_03920 [Bacteroidota bacterium]|nr:hypothetical protein [Bacteroidota bacterium]
MNYLAASSEVSCHARMFLSGIQILRFPPKACGNDDASVGVLNPIKNKINGAEA